VSADVTAANFDPLPFRKSWMGSGFPGGVKRKNGGLFMMKKKGCCLKYQEGRCSPFAWQKVLSLVAV